MDNIKKIKKCSVCKKVGHNKRSCQELKLDNKLEQILEVDSMFREMKLDDNDKLDNKDKINKLRDYLISSDINHSDEILKEPTLKDAHAYCVIHKISSQRYGALLENYILTKFGYTKNKAEECKGDCIKQGKNWEIKVSLGGSKHTKFNFVQIRLSHDCDMYILTAYHLSLENVDSCGELYIFNVPKDELKKLIVSYGGYAHGTIKEHGKIDTKLLDDSNAENNKEYALRPTLNDNCWKELLQFRVDEKTLMDY
jgi:hypothetical protein